MAGELILVVEDHAPFRTLLADVLAAHGYRVNTAANGEQALVSAEREAPALVLMDIRMPGMGGVEATRRLRARPAMARARIVALTASAMPEEVASYQSAGFDAFHVKPVVDLDRLVADLARLIERPPA
jgi:CheY-like chemotaxis protein